MSEKGEPRKIVSQALNSGGIGRGRSRQTQATDRGESSARSGSTLVPAGLSRGATRGAAPRIDSDEVARSSRTQTSMFESASDFTVQGGNFVSVTVNTEVRKTSPQLDTAQPTVFIHDERQEDHAERNLQEATEYAAPEFSGGLSSDHGPTVWQQPSASPVRRSCDIYYQHIGAKGRGSPLWIPEPNKNLHIEYQRCGLSIGDVGIITASGSFDYLFNICLPAEHPLNPKQLPDDFVPIVINPEDIQKQSEFKGENYLSSASVKESHREGNSFGLIFEALASEGAILTMPVGLNSEDLANIRRFRKYAMANAMHWYRYVMDVRGREVKNGDVRLVVGHDKTTAWGMATFSNLTAQKGSLQLKFRPVELDETVARKTYEWEHSGMAEVRAGPDASEIEALRNGDPEHREAEYENQCLFVRTLNINLRDEIWKELDSELGDLAVDEYPGYATYSDTMQYSAQTSASASSASSFQSSVPSRFNNQTERSSNPPMALAGHPSESINELLLKLHPNAQMAITEDRDWISVINEDDFVLPSPNEFFERIRATFLFREEGDIIFLEKKILASGSQEYRSTARPNSSSLFTQRIIDRPTPLAKSNSVDSLLHYLIDRKMLPTLTQLESRQGSTLPWTYVYKIEGKVMGTGTAASKNEAKQIAAQQVLAALGVKD